MTPTNNPAEPRDEDTEFVYVRRLAVEWLKTYYPALTVKAGLCESIGGRLYTRTKLTPPHQPASPDVARLVWEAEHGPIPADHLVRFKEGMRTIVEAEITVDRLECLDRAEHARRNQGPIEIRRVIQLRGAITRQINKRLKEQSA